MEHELKDIRYQSKTYERLETLMNRVNEQSLKEEHRKQARNKATGVDGVTKDEYGEKLDENVANLIERMKKFSYKPLPVRRVFIPKANGKVRPLGIPSYEDKLVQGVMARILSDIYEERFLDCSYGFRPGRSAHDAVKVIDQTIMTHKVGYVLEADIKGFFDNVNHDWLMKFLEHDIADKNFLRYIKRFLIAGVIEGTERKESELGTPQGGLISPVLANVYLHYALDLWVEKVLKAKLKGEVHYVRYADDFILMFQYENEAKAVMNLMRDRLKKFGLELAEDKTRILPFGRFKGTKEDFDFLGFTFFNTHTLSGKYRVGVRTSKKKLKAKRATVKEWLRSRLTKPISDTMKIVRVSLLGHYNYYGVSGNYRMLQKFYEYVKYASYRMLNRRDQKGKMKSEAFERIWNYYIVKPHLTKDIWTFEPKPI
ncbi:group II intron reverse transcriptase/maturase [Synergistales bacterium]|nr:group II intron reverse transcriptase/maturase [Synergistales bacterium]